MSIITISRGSYSRGKEVAEKLAQKLHYDCISRDILIEASEHFNIPEIRLVRAIHDAPSILDRFTYGKERYIAYIRAAMLKHMQKDNIVYHGLAGHFFMQEISHVLKVRIVADLQDRAEEEVKREKISFKEAQQILKKDDEERRKWSLFLYGKDTWDPSLYDMILHIRGIGVDEAVNIIYYTSRLPVFQSTPKSQRDIEDLSLAAQIQAAIVDAFPTAEVAAFDGDVVIKVKAPGQDQKSVEYRIKNDVKAIPGIKSINVSLYPLIIED
jgi:cytidylate kinase